MALVNKKRMVHPDLPGQPIHVLPISVPMYTSNGWVEEEAPEGTAEHPLAGLDESQAAELVSGHAPMDSAADPEPPAPTQTTTEKPTKPHRRPLVEPSPAPQGTDPDTVTENQE